MERLKFADWNTIPYATAYSRQKEYFETAIQNKAEGKPVDNTLILCEHPHVITIGKNGNISNLLFSEKTLKEKDVALFHIDRGGDVTYHGPGQLVGYPILDLDAFGLSLKKYVFLLEESIIELLKLYNIEGNRLEGATGVWIDIDQPGKTRKICAIGIRSSRYVTMHGFALNVNTDLEYFRLINPCGFVDKGVASMEKELGHPIDIQKLKQLLFEILNKLLGQYRVANFYP